MESVTGDAGGRDAGGTDVGRHAVGDPRLGRLLAAMRAVEAGDFRKRIVVTGDDEIAEICATFNAITERNQRFADDLAQVSADVGGEGRLGRRLAPAGGTGGWQDAVDAANRLLDNEDLEAIRRAATPLIERLETRRLIRPREEGETR